MTRLELRPGGPHAMNPLGTVPGSTETAAERLLRRHHLMAALLASLAGHGLDRAEDAVLGWALEAIGVAEENRPGEKSASLTDLAALLESPTEEMAARGATSRRELSLLARPLWLLLDKLVRRDLAGMFDGREALGGIAAAGTGIVLDVSAVFSDKALLRLVMLAAISVLQACYLVGDATDEWSVPRRFFVVDECWSLLGQDEAARFLQENWKLARARGVANVAVCHRVTDLGAQADSDVRHLEDRRRPHRRHPDPGRLPHLFPRPRGRRSARSGSLPPRPRCSLACRRRPPFGGSADARRSSGTSAAPTRRPSPTPTRGCPDDTDARRRVRRHGEAPERRRWPWHRARRVRPRDSRGGHRALCRARNPWRRFRAPLFRFVSALSRSESHEAGRARSADSSARRVPRRARLLDGLRRPPRARDRREHRPRSCRKT